MKRIIYFINGDKLDLTDYKEGDISSNKELTIQKYYKNNDEIAIIINNILYIKESQIDK